MSWPLPPDTRAVGSGNPPADMNQVIDALLGMNQASWIKPSGDATGATDAANINARLAAGGLVLLTPATYNINTPVVLASGSIIRGISDGGFGGAYPPGITEINLVSGSNCSMITAASGVNHWRLANLLLNANGAGQSGPAQTGSTGAAIHVADAGSPAELQAELDCVYVEDSYNDALYVGANRRALYARRCKFIESGLNGSTVYGAGNGVTCVYSDHVFDACQVGSSRHHGFSLLPSSASSIRITNCDIYGSGQDWASVTPTTVAAGSNGQAVSGLTAAGVLNVASTAGFPATGSLWINVSTGPVAVSYTGTSGGNQFTGVAVSATQGNQGGTLATGQGVYLFGGNAIHIGSAASGIHIAGNSVDRNYGCGVFAETAPQAVRIAGNHFLSNGQALTGLLPHIMLTAPAGQVAVLGNGAESVAAGYTAQCTYVVQSNGAGTWPDIANSWVSSALSTGKYTNNYPGISPFPGGSFPGQILAATQYAPASQVPIATLAQSMASLNAAPTTVAAGSNGGTISGIAAWATPGAGVLAVASTAGWPVAGTVNVAASGPTTAVVTYTGITVSTLTGCAYVSGSPAGTVATGGAVTLTSPAPSVSTGSFTAPPSGSVVVTASFDGQITASGSQSAFGLCAHGTLTPMVCPTVTIKAAGSASPIPNTVLFLVTGLTAGTSYNFDLMFATASGSTYTIYAFGPTATSPNFGAAGLGAPVIMTVQAA